MRNIVWDDGTEFTSKAICLVQGNRRASGVYSAR
jgi:hypothetical protein